jgi:uncharacterized protein with ParB-like and HNH nuclease domain
MSNNNNETTWNLGYSDIIDIFKNNLKIENTLKSIHSIFQNDRYFSKIDYKPYFQRNYVWDKEKATYFIESILMGTEIPPLVFFKGNKQNNEVIDGRQRFETLYKFISNDFKLEQKGLRLLKLFAEKGFIAFDDDTEDDFVNTKLRILQCSVSNEPTLSPEKEDKIKKEIFKRYNSGITPLKKEENARAEYLDDSITKHIKKDFDSDQNFLTDSVQLLLSRKKHTKNERDKINSLIDRIRTLLTLTVTPIHNYAANSHRNDVVRQFYALYIASEDPEILTQQLKTTIDYLVEIKKNLDDTAPYNDFLLYEALAWALLVMQRINQEKFDCEGKRIADIITNPSDNLFVGIHNKIKSVDAIFVSTGSHYRNATIDRYKFISNCLSEIYNFDFKPYLEYSDKFSEIMKKDTANDQRNKLRLIKPDPVSVTIDDILSDMRNSKFLVRPEYQRSEVKNIMKSSYLIESIILGIKIPPIYILKRSDRVKEVIDGQQRLLTIIGFIGETYIDENGHDAISEKHKFRLRGLKILKELNQLTVDEIKDKYPQYIDNIMDFPIDVVEIDEKNNPNFNRIDLFLRLNTKPFPIFPNTFEMWNAYVSKSITEKIKSIADIYEGKIFRKKDSRMGNEELITSLAYLDFQRKKAVPYTELLSVYLRDNHICARIASKDKITKMLEKLDSIADIEKFQKSIDNVDLFVSKLSNLLELSSKNINDLLGTKQKNDQHFYFLWIILENLSDEYIKTNANDIYIKISDVFRNITTNRIDYKSTGFQAEIYLESLLNIS